MSSTAAEPGTKDPTPTGEFSHRQIVEVMIGLMAALFTAMISSTIVSTALPTIMSDLHGTQRQYTWVITASLLAMTITTPIWGKLSDLFDKKLLVQLSIILFVVGSVGAGFSQEIWQMMTFRAVQGVAMGGLTALSQSVIGSIIAPRQRGRYSGYMGATMAVATVSGPLLGGLITDHLDWRWCFFVCVPLAVIALILLQITLKLPPPEKRKVKIDYLGAILIAITAAAPMLWVTFAGEDYAWLSWQSAVYGAVFLLAAGLAVVVELKAAEPMVPIRVLGNSTTALMIVASIGVGTGMFAGATFLTQYFQLAGGNSPTKAGLMTIPLILAQLISSVGAGQIVTKTGRWKPVMVVGSILMVVGMIGLGTIDHDTPYWQVSIFMAVTGIGIGSLIQNIVLAVQNTVDVKDVGASSATISFFRSLGGAVGVSVLGALLATHVQDKIVAGLQSLGAAGGQLSGAGSNLDIKDLPAPVQHIVHNAYGDSFGNIFLIAGIVAIVSVLAIVAVREVPLRTTVAMQDPDAPDAAEPAPVGVPVAAAAQHAAPAVTNAGPSAEVEWDGSSLDDPAERLSVASLDVLTAAQDRIRAHDDHRHERSAQVSARLEIVAQQVDAATRVFQTELQDIRDSLATDQAAASPVPDGVGGSDLRQYEYNLLLDAQQTADRVARAARTEATRTVADAKAERAELERRIEQLRRVEQELTGRVTSHLQDPAGSEAPRHASEYDAARRVNGHPHGNAAETHEEY
ncbi:MDR family MFS transporter [Nocardioides insulae]|uniref:MDR family MFS transporter n=1 Tax=Nocardioides insulae TaxID=394734 RepID=UPI0003FA2E24|nr:MFS transporter [Nocardioides insulae]